MFVFIPIILPYHSFSNTPEDSFVTFLLILFLFFVCFVMWFFMGLEYGQFFRSEHKEKSMAEKWKEAGEEVKKRNEEFKNKREGKG